MTPSVGLTSERILILAPYGRDAVVASRLLDETGMDALPCADIAAVCAALRLGAGALVVAEEVLQDSGYGELARWIELQSPWSDLPVVVLVPRGAGLERNPPASRYSQALGNISFLERPFHPTTLISIMQTALRGRRRQYEARERLESLREAVVREQEDQAHLRLMINELNHRVKNTLATVQSIVSQTLRGFDGSSRTRDMLTSRILALSKAHDVLTDEQWSGADLMDIATRAAEPFRLGLGDERVTLEGPPVRVPPKTAIAVALAFHELATNAVKYGALSGPDGHVEFRWTTARNRGYRDLTIVWREHDGPPVSPPTRVGFGTRLIERGLAADLNGEVRIAYPLDGVVCTIRARLDDADAGRAFTAPEPRLSRRPFGTGSVTPHAAPPP